jgi:hypothetical protein
MISHNKETFSRNEKFAYQKGYRVTPEGTMYGLRGQVITNSDTQGYIRVGAKKKGKYIIIYAHRLQAYQKYGNAIYSKGILVRHLDGNNKNNSEDNIALGTQRDNMMDRPKEDRVAQARKASAKTKKYNTKEVRDFYKASGNSYNKTKDKFGISSGGTLWYILNKAKM